MMVVNTGGSIPPPCSERLNQTMKKLTGKENLAVVILDMDKLTKEEFKELFDKAVWYINRIDDTPFDEITEAIEKVQEDNE